MFAYLYAHVVGKGDSIYLNIIQYIYIYTSIKSRYLRKESHYLTRNGEANHQCQRAIRTGNERHTCPADLSPIVLSYNF